MESETGETQLYQIPSWMAIALSIVYILVSLCAVLGNWMVLWTIIRSSLMKNVTNLFIANLAVADILIGALAIPFQFQAALLQKWLLPQFMCSFCPTVQNVSLNLSIFTLVALSLDRHRAVTQPLKPRITKKTGAFIILFIWFISILTSIPTLFAFQVTYMPAPSPAYSFIDETESSPPVPFPSAVFDEESEKFSKIMQSVSSSYALSSQGVPPTSSPRPSHTPSKLLSLEVTTKTPSSFHREVEASYGDETFPWDSSAVYSREEGTSSSSSWLPAATSSTTSITSHPSLSLDFESNEVLSTSSTYEARQELLSSFSTSCQDDKEDRDHDLSPSLTALSPNSILDSLQVTPSPPSLSPSYEKFKKMIHKIYAASKINREEPGTLDSKPQAVNHQRDESADFQFESERKNMKGNILKDKKSTPDNSELSGITHLELMMMLTDGTESQVEEGEDSVDMIPICVPNGIEEYYWKTYNHVLVTLQYLIPFVIISVTYIHMAIVLSRGSGIANDSRTESERANQSKRRVSKPL